MNKSTKDATADTASSRREHIDALIKETNYIGNRYAEGAPNDSKESTVAGMVEVLDCMLMAYKQGARSKQGAR